jgi:hypothetical protein
MRPAIAIPSGPATENAPSTTGAGTDTGSAATAPDPWRQLARTSASFSIVKLSVECDPSNLSADHAPFGSKEAGDTYKNAPGADPDIPSLLVTTTSTRPAGCGGVRTEIVPS